MMESSELTYDPVSLKKYDLRVEFYLNVGVYIEMKAVSLGPSHLHLVWKTGMLHASLEGQVVVFLLILIFREHRSCSKTLTVVNLYAFEKNRDFLLTFNLFYLCQLFKTDKC